jgi:hypothetical protein
LVDPEIDDSDIRQARRIVIDELQYSEKAGAGSIVILGD